MTLPDHERLRSILREAFEVYLADSDISHAVGKNGRLIVDLEIHLDGGLPRWTKGAVSFERRIDVKG